MNPFRATLCTYSALLLAFFTCSFAFAEQATSDFSDAVREPPDGFELTIFARPPQVNYPVCVCAAPTGELFVGIDKQGSLGKKPGQGRVERCIDTDDDGVADTFNTFATMDHPRGIVYDDGKMWVLHPPLLTLYHDDDHDGVADRSETIVTGITTDELKRKGADHTTNGIRMGIDGWIYIAVGDFGFMKAKGRDGRTATLKGGGVARVRPDGTELEVFAKGLRNIVDVCIDPQLNMFARDNTNDGGGWDVRLSHIIQSANYGYPSLYKNFPDELMPPLKDYGGGSGCGGLYISEPWLPQEYRQSLLTCDWGTQRVYFHPLTQSGATFKGDQEPFLRISAPTDADVDGRGRIYVSSWFGGGFKYTDENVGFVVQLRSKDGAAPAFPVLDELSDEDLLDQLLSHSHVRRFHAQQQIIKRGSRDRTGERLLEIARSDATIDQRVAAVFTYKQLPGAGANQQLAALVSDPNVGEFAIRAMTDRKSQLTDVPLRLLRNALVNDNPRVQLAALIGLGRLGDASVAHDILAVAAASSQQIDSTEITSQRALNHVAVKALVELRAIDACLDAIGGPYSDTALRVLRESHEPRAVEGLIAKLSSTSDVKLRHQLIATLVRLYHRESDYDGSWWGTRPDTSGPYYDRATWSASPIIDRVLRQIMNEAEKDTSNFVLAELRRHHVTLEGIRALAGERAEKHIAGEPGSSTTVVLPNVATDDATLIANRDIKKIITEAATTKGNPEEGRKLFALQQCVACHTIAEGNDPVGPPLAGIVKRYTRRELAESVVDPNAKIAQGFATQWFITSRGKQHVGFVVREAADEVELRTREGKRLRLKKAEIDERGQTAVSSMPKGLVDNLTVPELASLIAYLESLSEE